MSSPTCRAWQEILAKLSELLQQHHGDEGTSSSSEDTRSLHQVANLLAMLDKMPQQPSVVWRELIINMQQLPLRLGSTWCSIASAGTPFQWFSQPGHTSNAIGGLCTDAVVLLLSQVARDKTVVDDAASGSLTAVMQQQVLQSGLLPVLAQLTDETAQQLQHWNAAAVSANVPAEAGAHATVSSSSRQHQTAGAFGDAVDVAALREAAALLSNLQSCFLMLFADTPNVAVLGNTVAGMHLTVEAVKHISICWRQQQQDGMDAQALHGLVCRVAAAMMSVCSALSQSDSAATWRALQSAPHYLQWCAITIAVAVYAHVLVQQRCLPQVQGLDSNCDSGGADSHSSAPSTTHSSSGGRSSSRSRKAAHHAGRQPGHRQQHQTRTSSSAPLIYDHEGLALQAWQEAQGQWSSLPPSHTKLLEQLGCSVPAAVWLAGVNKDDVFPYINISICLTRLRELNMTTTAAATAAAPTAGGAPVSQGVLPPTLQLISVSPQLAQLVQFTHPNTLPALLLYGAAHMIKSCGRYQDHSDDDDQEYLVSQACQLSIFACHLLQGEYEQQAVQQQAVQQQQVPLLETAGPEGRQLLALPDSDELLLLSLKLLQQLQRYPRPPADAGAAEAQLAKGSTVLETHRVADFTQNMMAWVLCAIAGIRVGLSTAHQPSMLQPGSAGASGGQAAAAAPPPPPPVAGPGLGLSSTLAASAPAVCKVLEAFVRGQAGAAGTLPEETLSNTVWRISVTCSPGSSSLQEARPLLALAAAAGPGSELQLQLCSLWISILKWTFTAGSFCNSTFAELFPLRLCAETAVFLLACMQPEETAAVAAAEPAEQPRAAGHHSPMVVASYVASSSHGSNSSTSAHPGLMWLVLLGHCCLRCAALLAFHHMNSTVKSSDCVECVGHSSPVSDKTPLDVTPDKKAATACGPGYPTPVKVVADAVQRMLGPHSSMAQHLSASGYDVEKVTGSAAAVLAALDALSEAPDGNARNTALAQLFPAMDALCDGLTFLATPYCCNNPNCLNLNGPSDVVLVSGKSCICGKCKVARYCGKACQQQHWRVHKPVCKALAAAQQAAQPANRSGHS